MQPKKTLLTIISFLALILFTTTSFKNPGKEIAKKPCEATCQFSPLAGDFAAVSFTNCNSSASTSSVTSGTNWIPILPGIGCVSAIISVSLPAIHPAGTVTIEKNGTVILSFTTGVDEPFSVTRKVEYTCDDYYIVRF